MGTLRTGSGFIIGDGVEHCENYFELMDMVFDVGFERWSLRVGGGLIDFTKDFKKLYYKKLPSKNGLTKTTGITECMKIHQSSS